MIHVMVTCGAGFSSSSLVNNLNKGAKAAGIDNEIDFVYCPYDFGGIGGTVEKVDIVFLCPHLQWASKKLAETYPDKPFYVIPTRLYGMCDAVEYYEDAQDVLAQWKELNRNPFHFDGEEMAIKIKRNVSHRKFIAQQGK